MGAKRTVSRSQLLSSQHLEEPGRAVVTAQQSSSQPVWPRDGGHLGIIFLFYEPLPALPEK